MSVYYNPKYNRLMLRPRVTKAVERVAKKYGWVYIGEFL